LWYLDYLAYRPDEEEPVNEDDKSDPLVDHLTYDEEES
jgi:hypothetical protein